MHAETLVYPLFAHSAEALIVVFYFFYVLKSACGLQALPNDAIYENEKYC